MLRTPKTGKLPSSISVTHLISTCGGGGGGEGEGEDTHKTKQLCYLRRSMPLTRDPDFFDRILCFGM